MRREAGHHVRTLLIEQKKIKSSHRGDLTPLAAEFRTLSYLGAFMGLTPLCRMSRLGFSYCAELERGNFPLPREEYRLLSRLIERIVKLFRYLEESRRDGLYVNTQETVLSADAVSFNIEEIERLFQKRLVKENAPWEVKSLSIGKDEDFSHALKIPRRFLDGAGPEEGRSLIYLDLNRQESLEGTINALDRLSRANKLTLMGPLDLPYDNYQENQNRLPFYFLYTGNKETGALLNELKLQGKVLKVLKKAPSPKVPKAEEAPNPVESSREIIREVPFLPPELLEKIDRIAEQTRHEDDLPKELDLKKPNSRKLGVRFSIGFKLILIISTILVIAMSTMSFISFSLFENSLSREMEQNSLTVADLLSTNTEKSFDGLRETLRILLNNNRENLEETLINDYPYVLYFELVSSDITFSYPGYFSYEYIHTTVEENFSSLTEEAWRGDQNFRRTFNPSFFLTDSRNNEPVTGVILTYWDEEDNRLKPLIIIVKTSELLNDIINSTGSRTIFVLNDRGELIGHPNQTLVTSSLPGDFNDHPVLTHVRESGSTSNQQIGYKQVVFPDGPLTESEKAPEMLGAFTMIKEWGLFFVSEIKRDAIFGPIYSILRQNLYLMVTILSLAILLIYFFSKTITLPLARLMVATKLIEKGQYTLKLKVRNRDETGVLTQAFIDMGTGLEERKRMKDAFGRFVNKEVAEMAAKGELKLGGETKVATIFFSDIRAFTAISEKLSPDEVVEFLNEYMTEMVRCVNDNMGHVDKYIGDAIMGLWGVPKSLGNDPENCINCALAMREALIRFNKGRGGDKKPIIKIGCGINTGPVVSGQIGSVDRMEYTVIGDAVNLASRIEPLNKPMGTDILISTDTFELVKGIYHVVPMNKIMVKGKSEPQQIYAVLGRMDDSSRPKTLDQMRAYVGIQGDYSNVLNQNVDEKEVKYEIMD